MNNNGDDDLLFGQGYVTSLAIPFWTQPGFAIPIVMTKHDSNVTYVQRVNAARQIIGFDMFRPGGRVVPLTPMYLARIGNPEVFAFVDPSGRPHAGTRDELTRVVRKWVTSIEQPFTRLNFARFCRDNALAKKSAIEAVKRKANEFNNREQAILWFVDSIVLGDLVAALAQMRTSKTDRTIESVYASDVLSVRVTKNHLTIEMPEEILDRKAYPPKHQSARLSKILEFARIATGLNVDLKATPKKRFGLESDEAVDTRVAELQKNLQEITRQEKRLSVLLEAILSNPPVGTTVLNQHTDQALFMRRATATIQRAIKTAGPNEDIENTIAGVLADIIRQAYPRQKGRILLELAARLSSYPKLASIIRGITNRSRAHEVEMRRSTILEYL